MPVSLPSSHEEQLTSTHIYDVGTADAQNSHHSLDRSKYDYCSDDDSFSDSSTSLKVCAADAQFSAELSAVGIVCALVHDKLPVDYFDLDEALKQGSAVLNSPKIGAWADEIDKVESESGLTYLMSPELMDSIAKTHGVIYATKPNGLWTQQCPFSEHLGRPKPDFTFGLSFTQLQLRFPLACNLRGNYYKFIQPLPNIALPTVCVELKGPGGRTVSASNQNQNNCACSMKNIIEIKRAAGRAPKTYVERVLSVSVEISTEIAQVTCHWVTITNDGKYQYRSRKVQLPLTVYDEGAVKQRIANALAWGRKLIGELLEDLALLESRLAQKAMALERRKPGKGKRQRAGSSSELGEPVVLQPKRKKRAT